MSGSATFIQKQEQLTNIVIISVIIISLHVMNLSHETESICATNQ
jgi:hypothetical protein